MTILDTAKELKGTCAQHWSTPIVNLKHVQRVDIDIEISILQMDLQLYLLCLREGIIAVRVTILNFRH